MSRIHHHANYVFRVVLFAAVCIVMYIVLSRVLLDKVYG